MIKKTLFALGLSVGMLLTASSVFAAAYSPGEAPNSAMPENMQKMQEFMSKMQSGSLSSQDQKAMYGIMTQPPKMTGQNASPMEFNYKLMSDKPGAFMHSRGNLGAWFGLMFIFTVAMVWVVLLLLIGILWRQLKKHKHG